MGRRFLRYQRTVSMVEGSRPPLFFGLERSMYLKRKIPTSSEMVKMTGIF